MKKPVCSGKFNEDQVPELNIMTLLPNYKPEYELKEGLAEKYSEKALALARSLYIKGHKIPPYTAYKVKVLVEFCSIDKYPSVDLINITKECNKLIETTCPDPDNYAYIVFKDPSIIRRVLKWMGLK